MKHPMFADGLKRRKRKDTLFTGFVFLMGLFALCPLFLVISAVLYKGILGLFKHFTEPVITSLVMEGGLYHAWIGTVFMLITSVFIAGIIGVGTGIFIVEYANTGFAVFLRFIAEALTMTPSILIGLLVYGLFVTVHGNFSLLEGSIALAILMIPAITRDTEKIMGLPHRHLREGALAIGATKVQSLFRMVLPAAMKPLISAMVLTLARAMGETAPLLFISLRNHPLPDRMNDSAVSLPLQIYRFALSPYPDLQAQAWTGALTLTIAILLLVFFSRWMDRSVSRQRG